MEYNIKVYDIQVKNDELGVYAVSLVEKPAMDELFVTLNEQIKLSLDNDKQILIGPALVPDKLIYRIHPKTKEEFYIKFSAETIQHIALKYFKQGNQLNFNIEHSDNVINGVVMESWLVEDPEKDKSALYGFDVPKGTWMLSTYVEDKETWEKYVKSGVVKGYSIEGNFDLVQEGLLEVELTRASNVAIIVEYDDLSNQRLTDYIKVKELMNRIVVLSDRPGVTRQFIKNKYGIYVDDIYVNDYGQDLRSKLAWRGVKIAEIASKLRIQEYITTDMRVADMARKMGIRVSSPTRLTMKPDEVKEIVMDLIKSFETKTK